MGYEQIRLTIDRDVARISLNRPEQGNALTPAMHEELISSLRSLQSDRGIRVLLLTGEGEDFCSGADLQLLQEAIGNDAIALESLEAQELIRTVLGLTKPLVAAVHGRAVGGGCQLALLADYVVASSDARFSDGHVRGGLAAGDGGALIWPLLVGLRRAKQYLMTGDFVGADEAERIGLVNEVVAREKLEATASAWARRFADGPQFAIRWTKAALNQWLWLGYTTAYPYSSALEALSFLTPEFREAIRGITERGESAIPSLRNAFPDRA